MRFSDDGAGLQMQLQRAASECAEAGKPAVSGGAEVVVMWLMASSSSG